MRRPLRFALLIVVAGGALCSAADAPHHTHPARALPDWSGIWLSDDGIMDRIGLTNGPAGPGPGMFERILNGHPPYNPAWDARVKTFFAEQFKMVGQGKEPGPGKTCMLYFPAVMEGPSAFEVLITSKETAFIFEHGEVRQILTDGRAHPAPEDRWPTPWGDSIGRWEGSTLIVDTISVAGDRTPFFTPLSDSARFSERIRMVGKDELEDRLTVIDPVALTRPWTVTLPYKKVVSVDRIIHGDCAENDRDTIGNGKGSLAPR